MADLLGLAILHERGEWRYAAGKVDAVDLVDLEEADAR